MLVDNEDHLTERGNYLFSRNKKKINTTPKEICDGIYVETCLSTFQICNIIKKVLGFYYINYKDMKIYLTPLHEIVKEMGPLDLSDLY